MTPEERDRKDMLFEVRVQQFTRDMLSHQCGGRDAYELSELFVMWPDIGIDEHYLWRLN